MSGYLIIAYDVTNPEEYAKYNPGSMGIIMETLGRHGGSVVSAGTDSTWLSDSRHAMVVLKFPSVEAAQAWHDDPDYAPAKAIRLGASENVFTCISPEFVMPG